jgi:hypothetical protein
MPASNEVRGVSAGQGHASAIRLEARAWSETFAALLRFDQRGRVACAVVPAPQVHDAVLEVDDASDGPLVPHACRRRCVSASLMTTVGADGVTLGVEHFGDAAAPKCRMERLRQDRFGCSPTAASPAHSRSCIPRKRARRAAARVPRSRMSVLQRGFVRSRLRRSRTSRGRGATQRCRTHAENEPSLRRLRPLLDLPVELVLAAHDEPTDRAAL